MFGAEILSSIVKENVSSVDIPSVKSGKSVTGTSVVKGPV